MAILSPSALEPYLNVQSIYLWMVLCGALEAFRVPKEWERKEGRKVEVDGRLPETPDEAPVPPATPGGGAASQCL